MTSRGLNMGSNLNSAATSCKGFVCSEFPGELMEFEFFLGLLKFQY